MAGAARRFAGPDDADRPRRAARRARGHGLRPDRGHEGPRRRARRDGRPGDRRGGRRAIPGSVLRSFERVYPFGWLGVLSEAPSAFPRETTPSSTPCPSSGTASDRLRLNSVSLSLTEHPDTHRPIARITGTSTRRRPQRPFPRARTGWGENIPQLRRGPGRGRSSASRPVPRRHFVNPRFRARDALTLDRMALTRPPRGSAANRRRTRWRSRLTPGSGYQRSGPHAA